VITIHYRQLAFRRPYESVCLPVVPTIRFSEQIDLAMRETADDGAEVLARRRVTHVRADERGRLPAGTTPARTVRADERGRLPAGTTPARTVPPPTTREIPIAVDATLPAIATALARLETELATLGLGTQSARVRAIGLAVDRVRYEIEQGSVGALHRVLRGE
jgi:hypothetical protein